jgi:hypothetical protein
MLAGSLPPRALRLIQDWAPLHQDELLANWGVRATTNPWRKSIPSPNIGTMVDLPPLVHVTDVEVIGAYALRLTFEDGTVGDVSFNDRDWAGVFEPLRDPRRFARVAIEAGTIVWPDDDLDMAPEPLYAEARRHPVSGQALSA